MLYVSSSNNEAMTVSSNLHETPLRYPLSDPHEEDARDLDQRLTTGSHLVVHAVHPFIASLPLDYDQTISNKIKIQQGD
jgi:hypothetical protein